MMKNNDRAGLTIVLAVVVVVVAHLIVETRLIWMF